MPPRKIRRKRATVQRRRKKVPISLEVSQEQSRNIWGVIFGVFSVLSLLALTESLGIFGEYFAHFLFLSFGMGSYMVPILFGSLSLSLFFSREISMSFTRIIGLLLLLTGSLGILHIFLLEPTESMDNMIMGGGFFGAAGSNIPRFFLGDIGAIVILLGIALIGLILTFSISIFGLMEVIFLPLYAMFSTPEEVKKEKQKTREKQKKEEKEEKDRLSRLEQERREAEKKRADVRKKEVQKKEIKEEKPLISAKGGEWEFPPLSLLSDEHMKISSDEKELRRKEELIQNKLMEFGIGSELGAANMGPTVTQFTLKPNEGVKINKITGLKNDLALALSSHSLRLEAPIPGKDLIGIEIPNEKRATVHLKEILESDAFDEYKGSLRLAMGRDVAGEAFVANLEEMPHLLIAGATGSGKSVGMNTFLVSLLYQNSPADLKMILIDPKVVELKPYNNIPHLLTPVITDATKALAALRWAVSEMMRRYSELANKACRNIAEYNERSEEKMPKIIIVVDELADLMMRELKKETEAAICRLAQMARAVGMHIIIATQRPSVDVITGLIKANIPTRIAFAVTSSIDSRTILDSTGAEDLLGRGDMLLSTAALGKPKRIQGIYVSTEEIIRVTNYLKKLGEPEYDESVIEGSEPENGSGGTAGFEGSISGNGPKEQALEVIRQTGKASASLLQRRLSIGYARAARILDELEEEGYIGPSNGAKAREIYL